VIYISAIGKKIYSGIFYSHVWERSPKNREILSSWTVGAKFVKRFVYPKNNRQSSHCTFYCYRCRNSRKGQPAKNT